jgi:hypothetical protein
MGAVKTFVVRLFVPADADPEQGELGLHGFVEESASGRIAGFRSGSELVRFLATAAGGRQRPARPTERSAS